MAILIEGTTVVIISRALARKYPGGIEAFAKQVPNTTCHSDETLTAISFMAPADAELFARALTRHGLEDPWNSTSEDVAVVDQSQGFLAPCEWLNVDLLSLNDREGKPFAATIAWMGDGAPTTFAVDPGWYPRRLEQFSQQDLEENYEVVKVDRLESGGALVQFRHRETGRSVYSARTAHPSFVELQQRFRALGAEFGRLMNAPDLPQRAREAATLYERATKLIEECEPDIHAFLMQGVAARLSGDWDKAESAFRKVTELWPDRVDGWLELTWALSSLDRLDEAAAAARRAVDVDSNSLGAHCNLATTLLRTGEPEAALAAIERALELDSSDPIARTVRAQVQAALDEQRPSTALGEERPWYKRWFR